MSETPKSPGRRLLRKSTLQASPFGARIKPFHTTSSSMLSALPPHSTGKDTAIPTTTTTITTPTSEPHSTTGASTSPMDSHARRSSRISSMNINNDSSNSITVKPKKFAPPTTPKSKTILRSGVWGYIVGLKKSDESEYHRYPVDKSYCSFGRGEANDIRVQIEGVSAMHCKLIRRDDGEVWLKDTSTNGTMLNNILMHDTARPIEHMDVLTIAGRKFRFECSAPTSRAPLQSTNGCNTPSRFVREIQTTIDKDILALANAPSPSADRFSTPKKGLARSTASLEASLGLFTPVRAAKLSNLLTSPKPVPLPAFLAKSQQQSTSGQPILTMIDEPSLFNVSSTATPSMDSESTDHPGLCTPTREKRKAHIELFDQDGAPRTPKKVSFGPALSPEIFDKTNPPSTPIKRGQQEPGTPRRQNISTPSLLSKLSVIGSASKPILTPSRGNRSAIFHKLEKPAQPILFAQVNNNTKINAQDSHSVVKAQEIMGSDMRETRTEAKDLSSDGSDDGLWKKLTPVPVEKDMEANPFVVESDANMQQSSRAKYILGDEDEEDMSAPSTPSRGPMERLSAPLILTPTHPTHPASAILQQGHVQQSPELHLPLLDSRCKDDRMLSPQDRRTPSPTKSSINPTLLDDTNPSDDEATTMSRVRLEISSRECSTPPPQRAMENDTTPVNTPICRRSSKDIRSRELTPYRLESGSASKLTLVQPTSPTTGRSSTLSSADLQSFNGESSDSDSPPNTPTRPAMRLPLSDLFADDEAIDTLDEQMRQSNMASEQVAEPENECQEDEVDTIRTRNEATTEESAEHEDSEDGRGVTREPSLNDPWPISINNNHARRSSAPTTVSADRNQSPLFTGFRNVFWTPQKVVESCFAGFRNLVSKSPSQQQLMEGPAHSETISDDASTAAAPGKNQEIQDESATEKLDMHDIIATGISTSIPEGKDKDESNSSTISKRLSSVEAFPASPSTTPRKRFVSHQGALAILMGHSPPKSEELSFISGSTAISSDIPLKRATVRGRRSDIFPQKRTIADRSRSLDTEKHTVVKDNGINSSARRKTISLYEFQDDKATLTTATIVTAAESEAIQQFAPSSQREHIEQQDENDEDAEQAEILRLLGTGTANADEEAESATGSDSLEYIHDVPETAIENYADEKYSHEPQIDECERISADAIDKLDTKEQSTILSSRTSFGSRSSTPTKRRYSFNKRLGSSSPAFRLYEQDDDDEDENEEDMVDDMGKTRPNIHQTKYAPHNKRKLTSGEEEHETMKDKVARELELAKLRKQVVVDKPRKTIKKKPLSSRAKLRKEKTLERGLMNAEKDEKRIDKHQEKVTLKKRGKQMWE
ncbi:antigen identified by monoclonal antibody Ki-67 [Haplosporangium sp. Z 767]|nr:antigen identified by monoclonal antibody Ki-67 [Haplosporangium sp. Z 767]KAF9192225.1 antigen identified by monoclonal antibody Ki-67 [Haplosporangium sp. Z 11]